MQATGAGDAGRSRVSVGVSAGASVELVASLTQQLDDLLLASAVTSGAAVTLQDVYDLLLEIRTRLDLTAATPNIYNNDGSVITNDDFTLTKVDNGDGTFTVVKT